MCQDSIHIPRQGLGNTDVLGSHKVSYCIEKERLQTTKHVIMRGLIRRSHISYPTIFKSKYNSYLLTLKRNITYNNAWDANCVSREMTKIVSIKEEK